MGTFAIFVNASVIKTRPTPVFGPPRYKKVFYIVITDILLKFAVMALYDWNIPLLHNLSSHQGFEHGLIPKVHLMRLIIFFVVKFLKCQC
jgi:hypothetical protein